MASGLIKDIKTKEGFDYLLAFNDNEVKVIDNIKMSIKARLKADKEYSVNVIDKSIAPKTNFLDGFNLERTWNAFQEHLAKYHEAIIHSSDTLLQSLIPRIEQLIQEKKQSKKRLIDDKNKYSFSLKVLRDAVEKYKRDINKEISSYLSLKKKYSDPKSRAKKGSEIFSEMNKLVSSIHHLHNQYVISLYEYNEYNQMHTNTLIPGLLKSYQSIQETLFEEHKKILTEFYNHINSSNKFHGTHFTNIEAEINKINPISDYNIKIVPTEFPKNDAMIIEKNCEYEIDLFDTLNSDDDLFPNKLRKNELSNHSSLPTELNFKKNDYNNIAFNNSKKANELKNNIAGIEKEKHLSNSVRIIYLKRELEECEAIQASYSRLLETLKKAYVEPPPPSPHPYEPTLKIDRKNNIAVPQNKNKAVRVEEADIIYDDLARIDHTLHIKDQPWYHGILPRDVVNQLLINNGDFLIRETENTKNADQDPTKSRTSYVISVKADSPKHFLIFQNKTNNLYGVSDTKFDEISKLVEYLMSEPDNDTGVQFMNPVIRQDWEIKHADVHLIKEIGKGQFGRVFVGQYKNMDVAIKTCNEDTIDIEKKKFVEEGRVLQKFNHKNIVKFIGIAIDEEPIYIIMEFVNGGSLLKFLTEISDHNTLPLNQKLKLCEDCAEGMEYLESNKVIHRDLAARNCLIDEDSLVLKLADFGLSKEVETDKEENIYTMKRNKTIPIRWAAIESFTRDEISSKSDIWSYGVTIWEIFSYGRNPYFTLNNKQVQEFIKSGQRLECPDDCPQDIYEKLLLVCWHEDKNQRPNFTKILQIIRSFKNRIYQN